MGNPFGDAATFLVETLFGLYILAVMLRLLLQLFRADFYNPISQFLIKITQPLLRPLRRVVPPYRHLDLASVVLVVVLQGLKVWLILAINGASASPGPIIALALAFSLKSLLDLFFYAILIRIILSWLGPQGPNPVFNILVSITEPLLGPARRMMPALSMSGIDLTPMVVIIVLHLASLLLVRPVLGAAWQMAAGI